MIKNTLIIALIIVIIYLYYQQHQRPNFLTGDNSDSEDTIRDLKTQLSQAQALERFNTQQLERLQQQLEVYQQEGDWETKNAQIITGLENEVGELTTERDEAIREKRESEQELISVSNKLKLKNDQVSRYEGALEKVKKEKGEAEIGLNKSLTELRKEQAELKKKYSERTKQLDEEQTDNNKLTAENEKLTAEIAELKRSKSPSMPGNWDYEEELEEKVKKLEEQIQVLTNRPKSPMPGEWEEPKGGGEWERELKERHQTELAQKDQKIQELEKQLKEKGPSLLFSQYRKKNSSDKDEPDVD